MLKELSSLKKEFENWFVLEKAVIQANFGKCPLSNEPEMNLPGTIDGDIFLSLEIFLSP